MLSTVRHATRALARAPGFALLVVGCLGLGIGVNVAFMGVLDVLLLRPPSGVRAPATLHRVETARDPAPGQRIFYGQQLSRGDVERLAANRTTFAEVTGYTTAGDLSLGAGREARQVDAAVVDGAFFRVVGARAAVGRLLGPADAQPGTPRLAVLGEPLWRAAFGGDSGIVGRRTVINGEEVTIVGVVGDDFTGVEAAAIELWLSLPAADVTGWPQDFRESADARWLHALVRLAPGVTLERATAVATAALRAAPPQPGDNGPEAPRRAALSTVTSRFGGARPNAPVPVWLLGATAAVLLVSCANVANLLLARGEARRRELATRVALGASRGALVRQLLVESAVLATCGGVSGLALAQLGRRAFALLPDMPPLGPGLDWRITLATLLVVGVTTLLCGLAPALRGTRLDAPAALKSGARTVAGRSRLRSALMVGQLGAALALLATAGVFVRSLRAVHAIDTGFDIGRLITLSVGLDRAGIPASERAAFAERVLERVRALPGVEAAARAEGAPLTATLTMGRVSVEGATLPSPIAGDLQFVIAAGTDYFRAMGQPIRRGRAFLATDRSGRSAADVVIVGEAFARAAFGAADPVGRCVRYEENPCARVVGVAADVAYMGIRDSSSMLVYQPMAVTESPSTLVLVVRARGDAATVAREVRALVQGMDARMPYVGAYAMAGDPRVRGELAPYQLAAAAFSLFGTLALLVAAVGLYAVIAYGVARRTGEIGVRVALGATAVNIRRLVLGEGARHGIAGVALGVVAGAAATYALRARLYGVAPLDVPTFVVVPVLLLATALLASWLPARRAAAIPPTEALRSE